MNLHDALSHVESAIDAVHANGKGSVHVDWAERLREIADEIEAAMDLPNDETPEEA